MSRRLTCALLALAMAAPLSAQEPTPEKRGWFSRMLQPIPIVEPRAGTYKDSRLRGLVLDLKLSPQPVKLVRSAPAPGEHRRSPMFPSAPSCSIFPTEQRFEIYLRNSSEAILTIWSDNHAFEEKPGTVLINPAGHVNYPTTIATRDLIAEQSLHLAKFSFPNIPSCASGRNS